MRIFILLGVGILTFQNTCFAKHELISVFRIDQVFGSEKNENRGKFIGFNLVIFCYKEFEKLGMCKSIRQSQVIFIVYSDPIESGHVKINFHNGNTFKM